MANSAYPNNAWSKISSEDPGDDAKIQDPRDDVGIGKLKR